MQNNKKNLEDDRDELDETSQEESVEEERPKISQFASKKTAKIAIVAIIGLIVAYKFIFSGNKTENKQEKKQETPKAPDILEQSKTGPTTAVAPKDVAIVPFTNKIVSPVAEPPEPPKLQEPEVMPLPDFLFGKSKNSEKNKESDSQSNKSESSSNNSNTAQKNTLANTPQGPIDPTLPINEIEKSGEGDALNNPSNNMFVIGNGTAGTAEKREKNDFIIVDSTLSLKKKEDNVAVSERIGDMEYTIAQGKIMEATLETAINSSLPGSVRAIVARDVFGEAGKNVLIPKGSRLYGTYGTNVAQGQQRITISWNRLIRPDGVSVAISSQASDQFGRAGIEGDVDNKYGELFANSLLLSFISLGTAIAVNKFTGGTGQTQITSGSTGTVTTSNITPVDTAAQQIVQTASNISQQLTSGLINVTPVISLPQGTRINVLVNQDLKLPSYNKQKI